MAARAVPGRPVKLALTRQQMFFLAGYRTPTIQRMQLAADPDGRLRAIAVDVVEQTSMGLSMAVVNAAYRATGVRVRDLPLTLDRCCPG